MKSKSIEQIIKECYEKVHRCFRFDLMDYGTKVLMSQMLNCEFRAKGLADFIEQYELIPNYTSQHYDLRITFIEQYQSVKKERVFSTKEAVRKPIKGEKVRLDFEIILEKEKTYVLKLKNVKKTNIEIEISKKQLNKFTYVEGSK